MELLHVVSAEYLFRGSIQILLLITTITVWVAIRNTVFTVGHQLVKQITYVQTFLKNK